MWLRLIQPFGGESTWTEWLPRWEGLNKPCSANGSDIFKNAAVLAQGILALKEKWQLSPGETLSLPSLSSDFMCEVKLLTQWGSQLRISPKCLDLIHWWFSYTETYQIYCGCSTSVLTCRTNSGHGHYTLCRIKGHSHFWPIVLLMNFVMFVLTLGLLPMA